MQITSFTINSNNIQLDLVITDAAAVTSLRVWTENTFKDFTQAIDLSSKLTGSATENITISLADLGITEFDGIYFIEAEDTDETSLEYAYDISRYKECVIDRLLELEACDQCLDEENIDLINVAMNVDALEHALAFRFIDEILNITSVLNSYCSNSCQSCGTYANVEDNNSNDILNPDDIIINVDGGGAST